MKQNKLISPQKKPSRLLRLVTCSFTQKRFLGSIGSWRKTMKRGRTKNPREYIEIRIEQLLEDRKKEKDSFNRQWLWRVISELKYVATMMDKDSKD